MGFKEKLQVFWFGFTGWIYRIQIESYPNSPYYPSYTKIYTILFNRFVVKSEQMWLHFDKHGRLELDEAVKQYPKVKHFIIDFPEDWHEQLAKFDEGAKSNEH